ncbi:MAG: RNA polymerase sigma factor [Lachnospiraceae bacterium]|nr:RNA polymerase sigma factor [Lachnospiraceae bacterium]
MREPVENLIKQHQKHLFAAAFSVCQNASDADDVVQDTFLKYHLSKKEFSSPEHIKAWLLRVAINKAKRKISRISAARILITNMNTRTKTATAT